MLISIIIPCFNVSQYIVECLESCINQNHKNIEIICIDNNSTDDTVRILDQFKIRFKDLIIDSEVKPGANAARNKGLTYAKGQWIQFLDADDLLLPSKIEQQLSIIKTTDDRIGFIAGASKKLFVNGNERLDCDLDSNNFTAAFFNKSGNTCSNLWNKNALLEVGSWNERIKSSQETDLMLKLALAGYHFLVDKKPLTLIRERESGQISHRDPVGKWKQFIDVRLNYLERLEKEHKELYERYKGVFFDFLMVSVVTLSKHNRSEAICLYERTVKNNWISSGNYGFNKLKVAFIKIFGFETFLKFYKR